MDRAIIASSLGFLGLGSVMLVGAIVDIVETKRFVDHAVVTMGEVIGFEERIASDDDIVYSPVFRFETVAGRRITFGSRAASSPPAYDVGERVAIFYLEEDPSVARENSYAALWGIDLFDGALGTVLATVGGVLIVFGRAKATRDEALKCDETAV